MQLNSSDGAATLNGHGADAERANMWPKVAIAAVLVIGAWAFARFNGAAPLPASEIQLAAGSFAQPQAFVAAPGANNEHINIRSGPGGGYRIKEQIARGQTVTGVGRTTDSSGAFWIELADGRGFAKETVLVPTSGVSPAAVQP